MNALRTVTVASREDLEELLQTDDFVKMVQQDGWTECRDIVEENVSLYDYGKNGWIAALSDVAAPILEGECQCDGHKDLRQSTY